jgi:hypothetical protein
MKSLVSLVIAIIFVQTASAQELQAKFSIVTSKVGSGVDKKIFQSLQTVVTNFLNNRKWTSDNFQPQEKIKCSFLFTVDEYSGNNEFKGTLTVQAARPIYNTSYESPIINMQDPSVQFRYVEFQPLDYNENRIQGSDPLTSNLTAILAYYVNIILGMDYDSFSPRGGDPYFQKADYIVNNAPEGGDIIGWKTFEGLRNRQKLIQGFTDTRFNLVHDALYSYYRGGFDKFYENEGEARTNVLNALNSLNSVNSANPGSMVIQLFFQGKSNEIVKMFSKADTDVKTRARDLLLKLDLTNASAYKELK